MTTTVHAPAQVDAIEMRNAMAAVPTSVCVVSGDITGPAAAIVVGSFVSISLEPALVGFFVGLESSTWPTLRNSGRLGISVLGSDHVGLVREITKKEPGRFDSEKWTTGGGGEMLIRGAVTHMTGSIESTLRVGDHDFVIAALTSIESREDQAPLVFQGRQIQALNS